MSIGQILLWLAATFSLPLAEPPLVAYVAAEIIAAHRGGDVVAVYVDETKTVYLNRNWDADDPADVSVLVHELVHHLQNVAGMHFACPEEREKLAYQAQQAWLERHGMTLESALGIDAMTLKLRTSCFR